MNAKASLLTSEEVRGLVQCEEGQFLEFKSLWDRSEDPAKALPRRTVRDRIAEYVAAFANADGGTLLLGVEDDGSPSGHGYPAEEIESFFATPNRRIQPPVPCRTARVELDGKEILVLEVPDAPEAVMVEGDGYPYRSGDQVVRQPQEVISQLKEARRRVGYEQRCRHEATLEDLDLGLVARFFQGTPFANRTAEDLLVRFGLVQARASGWAVTHAALLLFGKEPVVRWHPRMSIRFFRVEGTERRHGRHRNVVQGPQVDLPLVAAIPEAHRLGRELIRRSEKLHDLFFRETPEYPDFAWQEAIVNAVAHRDYEVQGVGIEVWFFDDRMEVCSPGAPIAPASLEALRARRPVHASRNPLTVRVLAVGGLMRDEGEGIPRIFEEMEGSFLRPPSFDLRDGTFVVSLFNEPIFTGPSREWQQVIQALPISVSQIKALLAHPEGFTNGDYQKLNQVDRDEAYRQIQDLVVRGVLRPSGKPGRGAVYQVSEDLRQARGFLEARVPTLREFFRRQDKLRNADYRNLFELSRYASVRELRRLVEEGFLRMEGERRGAHYLPGDLMPGEVEE